LAPPEPTGTGGGDLIDLSRAQIVNAPMVTAGNARDSGGPMIAERSQVVTVPAAVGTWSF
jgi:hypothetical protein